MKPALELLADLVALPGPPGQEGAVRQYLTERLSELGLEHTTDAKGNLLTSPCSAQPDSQSKRPRIVVTAHLDEIALMVSGWDADGAVSVVPLGGAHPYKWGEGPVVLLTGEADIPNLIPGVLSFGSIHTTAPSSAAQHSREGKVIGWEFAFVQTGLSSSVLRGKGVRPGTRVALAPERRTLFPFGENLVGSYFLDDRADLVAWLLALEQIKEDEAFADVVFAATASEEVGGEGALYLLHELRPEICVALEIGPSTPDAPFPADENPTIWVSDTYAASQPKDLNLLQKAGSDVGIGLYYHVVTRGGSDASCAAANGLCARPVTIAFAAENSHGFEIMHRDAPENLARLLIAYLRRALTLDSR